MLETKQNTNIIADHDRISTNLFAQNLFPPIAMRFAQTVALLSRPKLATASVRDCEQYCRLPCTELLRMVPRSNRDLGSRTRSSLT